MNNFEYSDYHKFIVSIGLAAILFSLFLPWLMLKESFDLRIQKDEIEKMTESAKQAIEARQADVVFALSQLRLVCGVLFITGVVFCGYGLYKWAPKQKLLDRQTALSVQEMEGKLQKSEPPQLEQPITDQLVEGDFREFSKHAATAETTLLNKIDACMKPEYVLLQQRQLGTAYFDAVLAANREGDTDFVIEVGYVRKTLTAEKILDKIRACLSLSELYSRTTHRTTRSRVFLIVSEEAFHTFSKKMVEVNERLVKEQLKGGVTVQFIHEGHLSTISCAELKTMFVPSTSRA